MLFGMPAEKPWLDIKAWKNNRIASDARWSSNQEIMTALASAQEKDRIVSESVGVAQRSAELAFLRYQEGFADYQRVLDAQQALFSQQQRYAANRGEVVRSVIQLYRSLGGGWQQ